MSSATNGPAGLEENPTCAEIGLPAPPPADGWDDTGLVVPPTAIDNEFVSTSIDLDENGQPFRLDVTAKDEFAITAVIIKGDVSSTVVTSEPFSALEAPANPDGTRQVISQYTICGTVETTPPETTPPETTPPATATPELAVDVLEPICDNDVPYLEYEVSSRGFEADAVRMTWVNPDGDDFVYEDLPLSGRVLWPGAEVDSEGNPLDWPGWRELPDGTWVEGDEWDWVRPNAEVEFEVNPSLTVTVDYPPSSPECLTNPPGETLPKTGGNNTWPALVGAGLIVAGGAAVAGRSRFARR